MVLLHSFSTVHHTIWMYWYYYWHSQYWYTDISPLTAKNYSPVPQMPHSAAVLWLCGPSAEWGPGVGLQHLCYWYYSLSHFSCLGEAQASKLGPADPALLSAALNINTCLRGPINTRYRGEAMKEREPACMKMESGAAEERRRNGKET